MASTQSQGTAYFVLDYDDSVGPCPVTDRISFIALLARGATARTDRAQPCLRPVLLKGEARRLEADQRLRGLGAGSAACPRSYLFRSRWRWGV